LPDAAAVYIAFITGAACHKKHGNREADFSGKVSHQESLAENRNEANTLVGALWASLYEQ
jgi:hypothetical protein